MSGSTVTKEQIDEVFRIAAKLRHQSLIISGLYRLVIPDFDRAKRVNGWPKCGEDLGNYIARRCIEFDQVYHPNVFAGGLWLNQGWIPSSDLQPWAVDITDVEVEYGGSQ